LQTRVEIGVFLDLLWLTPGARVQTTLSPSSPSSSSSSSNSFPWSQAFASKPGKKSFESASTTETIISTDGNEVSKTIVVETPKASVPSWRKAAAVAKQAQESAENSPNQADEMQVRPPTELDEVCCVNVRFFSSDEFV
jgi:hypothetical protein